MVEGRSRTHQKGRRKNWQKDANKKFQRECDIQTKELKRLKEDTRTLDNLKRKLEKLKKQFKFSQAV
jgi:hypothetical protein